jgi:hypothetical protein
MLRRVVPVMLLAVGIAGIGPAAQAAPAQPDFPMVTVGCAYGEGGFDTLRVLPLGSVAFVVDEGGTATGEKLFIVSLDAAVFSDTGELLGEFHKAYGKRKGHGEPISCSGSFEEGPDATVFFDVLVTRR